MKRAAKQTHEGPVARSFKSELRIVKREGGAVYRASIPSEVAEQRSVRGKYLRLRILVKGSLSSDTEFTAKLLENPFRVQIPKQIVEVLGLTRFPTSIQLEFLGVATKPERTPTLMPKEKSAPTLPIEGPSVRPTPTPGKEPVEEKAGLSSEPSAEIGKELSALRGEVEKKLAELREEVEKLRGQGASTPQAPLPSDGLGSLRGLLYRTVEKTATEMVSKEVADYCRESIPKEVEKVLPGVLTDLVKGQLGDVLTLGEKARAPSKPPVKTEAPSEPEPPSVQPAPGERVVTVETPKTDVVRVGPHEAPRLPERKQEIRFERDGDFISIFKGDKHISTVSLERTSSGIRFICGTCTWSAIGKGQEPTFSECEHIQMAKKFLHY